jgi:hypothetical protein
MEIKTHENYVYTTQLNLNLPILVDSSYKLYDFVKHNFDGKPRGYVGGSTITTELFNQYNALLYPLPQFHELYFGIREMFHTLNDNPNENFYMQCWLNYYRTGDFIDWHDHWKPEFRSWHGFYCVSGKGSYTTYKLPPDHEKEVVIPTILNQIVLSKSDGDIHRSSEWNEDYPRITIAFDIVPSTTIKVFANPNHWIPV